MPPTNHPTEYTIRSKVTKYPGHAGWHFVSIGKTQSKQIKTLFGSIHRGWGSLPVQVSLGESKWKTSIFYSKKDAYYIMGLKAAIRKAEGVKEGDTVKFGIVILGV